VTATAPAAAPWTMTGNIVSTATDPLAGNNSSTGTAVVNPVADVSITKTGPASLTPGTSVTYKLLVANAGPSTATGVTLDDPTPAGLTFFSTDVPCGTLPCSVGTYAPGASRMYQ